MIPWIFMATSLHDKESYYLVQKSLSLGARLNLQQRMSRQWVVQSSCFTQQRNKHQGKLQHLQRSISTGRDQFHLNVLHNPCLESLRKYKKRSSPIIRRLQQEKELNFFEEITKGKLHWKPHSYQVQINQEHNLSLSKLLSFVY